MNTTQFVINQQVTIIETTLYEMPFLLGYPEAPQLGEQLTREEASDFSTAVLKHLMQDATKQAIDTQTQQVLWTIITTATECIDQLFNILDEVAKTNEGNQTSQGGSTTH